MSDTINGFPIIATWATPQHGAERAGRIIVVDRGAEYKERYVVAWQAWCSGGREQAGWARQWDQSAYCLDLAEATHVFAKQIEREVRR